MKVIVYHTYYGCDSGCCGHAVEMGDRYQFNFDHPCGEDARAFAERLIAQELGAEHIADLDWENCAILED